MKRWICSIVLVVFALFSLANTTLTGRVTDPDGLPVSFASVYVENNPLNGTVTDANGVFVLPDVQPKENIVVSFIGFKTIEVKLKKVPTDTLRLQMQEQPILLSETEVSKERKHISKRRQKKNLLKDVYAQLMHDFPANNHFYKVISDYAIYNDDQIAAFEELSGNIVEIPLKDKHKVDSIQLLPNWVKRYRHPETRNRLDGIENRLRKDKNAQRIQLVDSSIFVHRVLWGGDIKSMFSQLKDKVSKWESYEQDSALVLSFSDNYNFLGILKIKLVLNLVLDPYSYCIQKQSQDLQVEAHIPFGYKLNADQLAILNTVVLTSESIEKFRLKHVFADVKRNILYQTTDNKVYVDEKNIITKVKMVDNKDHTLYFHQTGHVHVLSASTSEVVPYTKEQLQQPYNLIIE
jgi:hypothetical protein